MRMMCRCQFAVNWAGDLWKRWRFWDWAIAVFPAISLYRAGQAHGAFGQYAKTVSRDRRGNGNWPLGFAAADT